MTTAKLFAYKGHVAAEIDINGKFLNDIHQAGQLGAVISTSEIEITKEAKEIIKNAKREGGSFAELMLTKHTNPEEHGKSSMGILGFGKVHLGDDFSIGRDCDVSILEDCSEVEIDISDEYKSFIDSL